MKAYWKEKRVLITGGTSGLGEALARQLHAAGAAVAIVARSRAGLERIAGQVPGVAVIEADVADKRSAHRIQAEALAALGGVDVLINNASTLGPIPLRLLLDTDCEDLASALETNVIGPFRLIKLLTPAMLLRESGLVINISSDAAVGAYPKWGSYGASKAALDHMTRTLQAELEGSGVRLVSWDPGDMDTPMHRAALPDADFESLHRPEQSADLILAQAAEGRLDPVRRSLR